MFLPSASSLAFSLVLTAMLCWGSWTFLRGFCRADAPIFAPLYFLGQWVTAYFICISLGEATSRLNPNFDESIFSFALLSPGSPGRVVAVFLGGFINANADFLCAAACTRLPFSVASPIFAGDFSLIGYCRVSESA